MKSKHIPERMCAVCRQRFPKSELNRFVVGDNETVPDESGKALGRGIYVCNSEKCQSKFSMMKQKNNGRK